MHTYPRHQATSLFPPMKPRTGEQDRAAERTCERPWFPLRSQPPLPLLLVRYLAWRCSCQTCGDAGTLSCHLLAGARQGATAGSGAGGTGDHDRCRGGVAAASIPITRSAIYYCLLRRCTSLLMNARRHPSEAQPGPKYFTRRRRLREHRVGHVRDNGCRECHRYRTWTHDHATAGHFGRMTSI